MKMYVLYEFWESNVAIACSYNKEKIEQLLKERDKILPAYCPRPWIEIIEEKDEIFNLELT